MAIGLVNAQEKMTIVAPVRCARISCFRRTQADCYPGRPYKDPSLVVFGRPMPILWEGGRRPFKLSIVKADNLSHTACLPFVFSMTPASRANAYMRPNFVAFFASRRTLVVERHLDLRSTVRRLTQRPRRGACRQLGLVCLQLIPLSRFAGSGRTDGVLGAAAGPQQGLGARVSFHHCKRKASWAGADTLACLAGRLRPCPPTRRHRPPNRRRQRLLRLQQVILCQRATSVRRETLLVLPRQDDG